MTDINKLICFLIALQNFSKDIHYSCYGESFYAKHLLADRLQEDLYEYIDQIKEICLLGEEVPPLPSTEYLKSAAEIIPLRYENDDHENFVLLQNLLVEILSLLEKMEDLTKGEENLLGNIAQDLQQRLGLVNQQIKE